MKRTPLMQDSRLSIITRWLYPKGFSVVVMQYIDHRLWYLVTPGNDLIPLASTAIGSLWPLVADRDLNIKENP